MPMAEPNEPSGLANQAPFNFGGGIVTSGKDCKSPGETLLHIINIGGLFFATGATNIITQTPASTDHYTHGTDLVVSLSVKKSVDVGTARVHVHCGRWALDFPWVARTGNEERDF